MNDMNVNAGGSDPAPGIHGAQNGFLILGTQRTGTSLMTRILSQHPNITVPPESFFFNTFCPLRKHYGDLASARNLQRLVGDVLVHPKIKQWSPRPTQQQIMQHLTAPTLGGVFRALMDSWRECQDKPRWGEKTPHHVFFWPEIAVELPDIPIVLMVRDGRDVALSLMAARFGPTSVYRAAKRWVRWMEAIDQIKASVPAERWLQVHYEDLLDDAAGTLQGLCRFLGETYTPEMLEFHQAQTLYSDYEAEHANLKKQLLTDNKQKWRKRMPPRELAVFQDVAGAALTRYGYPLAEDDVAQASALERFYEHTFAELQRKPIALLRNRIGQREEFDLLKIRLRAHTYRLWG